MLLILEGTMLGERRERLCFSICGFNSVTKRVYGFDPKVSEVTGTLQ